MSRWNGVFDLAIKFAGFLYFTGEMAETPESSEHIDIEETSTTDEGVHLVDTIDDPSLSWVGPEPRGIASISRYTSREACTIVEYGDTQEGLRQNFTILRPTLTTRICSEFEEDRFPMYEVVFIDLELCLPFSDFQMGVFNHLNLTPSKLHLNAITFTRTFEITRRFLRIRATIPLFFRVFHLQQ